MDKVKFPTKQLDPRTERPGRSTKIPKSPRSWPAVNAATAHVTETVAPDRKQAAISNPRTNMPGRAPLASGAGATVALPIVSVTALATGSAAVMATVSGSTAAATSTTASATTTTPIHATIPSAALAPAPTAPVATAPGLIANSRAPEKTSSLVADLVAKAQEEIDDGNPDGACEVLSLPGLCATSTGTDIITVCYENDLGYTDHFFNYNQRHLENAPQNFIVVLDGLPEMAKPDGYRNCKSVPASLKITGLTIVGLSNSRSTQVYSNLQYASDALKKVSSDYAATKVGKAYGARMDGAGLKASRDQLLRDIETNLKLHQIEGDFPAEDEEVVKHLLKLIRNNRSSDMEEISKGLSTLALSLMKKNKTASMTEEFSPGLRNTRAAQIVQLQAEYPGRTIIVRCGARILHSTRDEKSGAVQTGFMKPLSRSNNGNADNGVLSLVMVRNNQKADTPVSHRTISMKVGDDQKVATTDECIAIDYTLLRAAAENRKGA